MLREAILDQPYKDALAREFPAFTQGFYPSKLAEHHQAGLDQLWQRLGGTGRSPLTRSGYDELGDEDDAMPVDPFLYDRFLTPYAGTDRQLGDDSLTDFADLDGDEADASFIGRKWLIVVDYHN